MLKTKKDRLDYFRKVKGLKYADLIGDESIVTTENLRVTVSRENDKIDYYLSLIATKHNISKQWLIEGEGNMEVLSMDSEPPVQMDFIKLPIEEKLNFLHTDNILLKEKIHLLEKKNEIAQEINRIYLKAIIAHLSVGEDLNEDLETLEIQLKKISSN